MSDQGQGRKRSSVLSAPKIRKMGGLLVDARSAQTYRDEFR